MNFIKYWFAHSIIATMIVILIIPMTWFLNFEISIPDYSFIFRLLIVVIAFSALQALLSINRDKKDKP